jgi:uncharacterized protein YbjT (DUF2867 family)
MILVTGATGFVGRQVVASLKEAGLGPIRCLTRRLIPAQSVLGAGVEIYEGDVTDPQAVQRAMDGVQRVIHLVAVIREKSPDQTFINVNYLGTRNVADAARISGVSYLVHVSANGAQRAPRYRYAFSKWLGEQEILRSGIPCTILRPSILFGPGDEFFNILAAVVRLFPLVPVAGHGDNRFQPIAVTDVARCVVSCLQTNDLGHPLDLKFQGRIIPIGGLERFSYNQLLDIIADTIGVRRRKGHVPVPLMRWMSRIMGFVLPRPPMTSEQLSYMGVDNIAALDSVEQEFDFTPVLLRERLDYVRDISTKDAVRIGLGRMPLTVRDH